MKINKGNVVNFVKGNLENLLSHIAIKYYDSQTYMKDIVKCTHKTLFTLFEQRFEHLFILARENIQVFYLPRDGDILLPAESDFLNKFVP